MNRNPLPYKRALVAAVASAAVAASLAAVAQPATAEPEAAKPIVGQRVPPASDTAFPQLPGPPRPPAGRPRLPKSTVDVTTPTRSATTAAVAAPAAARTFGGPGLARTLVLYDGSGEYGWLGEFYGLAAGTLASHFGQVTAEPVSSYVAGQIEDHTATVYLGSTYNEALPAALLHDVTTTAKPVIWSGFNVWQLSGASGSAQSAAFQARYGWDPSTSYLDTTDRMTTVSYKGQTLTRSTLNASGVLSPHILDPAAVTVLARANCTDSAGVAVACAPIAQATGTSLPWAIRSANLTYLGELPFPYMTESDRYLAFADLLFPALAPTAASSKRAAVRLEDVDPTEDPQALRRIADYLSSQRVPFTVGVIPEYRDPNGEFTGGTPQTIRLAQTPQVVSALKYMQTKGGTLIQHGTTHQFGTLVNPYNGVSGDDFEFYRARCSATQNPPYQFRDGCEITDWVILQGAVPGDSTAWAESRVRSGRALFGAAGLSTPTIFETPHYSASAADYAGMRQVYSTRYERELFFGGLLSGATDPSRVFGQFFPYTVHDIYGTRVLPENLGNYEPIIYNNNPPRSAADVVANARANLVVTQGVASFFFHPDYPLSDLQQIVTGIKGLGYTFVPAASLN